jgi:23S rRNA (uracil1939-C5)-methyltransferase
MSETPNETAPPAEKPAQRGDAITLTVEKFADQGKGLARHASGLVVFVPQGVPGDRVRAKVTRRQKNFAEARPIELLDASAERVEPRCRYFGSCGGCDWQHVRYDEQARMKQQSVREALLHTGGVAKKDLAGTMQSIIAAERPYLYRNKMIFDFSAHRWLTPAEVESGEDFDTGFALGLHAPKSPHQVLDLKECHLQSRRSRRLVNRVRSFAKEQGWAPWNVKQKEGFLRHLVLREPEHTDDLMLRLVTSRHAPDRIGATADFLKDEAPAVTTFVHTFNDTPRPQAAQGGAHRTVFGEGVVREELGGLAFEIGPETFFQTNTRQAERLFAAAREMAALHPGDRVYDLYCGAGALSLFVASAAAEVLGIEGSEQAVAAARRNAGINEIGNARFWAGAVRDRLAGSFAEKHGPPDVLLADPPRAGMREAVVEQIATLRPERLVYVSCDPQTQARDVARLRHATGGAYRIQAVQPVDLFPQTARVENIVALRVEEG